MNAIRDKPLLHSYIHIYLLAKVGKSTASTPDGYCLGIVIKTWDSGNAYRIELADGKKTNVWGPIDEDNFVKSPAQAA